MISPQALMAARQLQGVSQEELLPAIGGILEQNPKMPLMQLIAAHKMLTQQQQQQQAMQAMQMAQQGGGVAPQQPTTVAQDTKQGLAQLAAQDQQPMMQQQQQAAPQQPMSQEPMSQEPTMQAAHGGLMGLPVHNFRPEHYAHGGIVAFGDPERNPNEAQVVREERTSPFIEGLNSLFGLVGTGKERRDAYKEQQEKYKRDLELNRLRPGSFEALTPTERASREGEYAQAAASPNARITPTPVPAPASSATAPTEVPSELVTEPPGTPPGLAGTPEGRARTDQMRPAAAAPVAATSTPAIDAAIAQSAATRERLAATLDVPKEAPLSRDQAQTRAEKENADALKAAGAKSYKDRIDEFKGLATQAREDRNTDRWLAVAQGFFAMGAGKSRYAMQNMAEGLGIGVGQLKEAEKEHRKGEQARRDRINLLEEAHRQETLGNVKAGRELYEKAVGREEDRRKSDLTVLGHLASNDQTMVGRLVASHDALKTRELIAAGTQAEARSRNEATAAFREGTLEEKRYRREQEDARHRRALYARATEKHPGYKALQDLSQGIADMQSRPDLTIDQQKNLQAKITQHNALQAAIHTAADAAAQREFGAGGGEYSNFRQGQ